MSDSANIKAVETTAGRIVHVTWKGGSESVIDLGAFLDGFAVFAPLRADDMLFRTVAVGEWGWSLHWSDDMEIAADTLRRLALEQGAAWLRAWRETRHMSEADAARALGVSPRLWRGYEAGTHLLPKTVWLAGLGFDALTKAA